MCARTIFPHLSTQDAEWWSYKPQTAPRGDLTHPMPRVRWGQRLMIPASQSTIRPPSGPGTIGHRRLGRAPRCTGRVGPVASSPSASIAPYRGTNRSPVTTVMVTPSQGPPRQVASVVAYPAKSASGATGLAPFASWAALHHLLGEPLDDGSTEQTLRRCARGKVVVTTYREAGEGQLSVQLDREQERALHRFLTKRPCGR